MTIQRIKQYPTFPLRSGNIIPFVSKGATTEGQGIQGIRGIQGIQGIPGIPGAASGADIQAVYDYINKAVSTKDKEIKDINDYLARLYRALSEEGTERVIDFDILKLSNVAWYDVRNYPSLALAITSIGATSKTLLIPTAQTVAADITIPATLSLKFTRDGKLNIANGVTVTINGYVEAGLWQVFSCTGTGKVVFGANAVTGVHPDWWTANTTPGTTDMTTAVQAAADACLATATRPIPFLINDRCKLTAPIIINRTIDASVTTGAFRIIGIGKTAGFYVATAIAMFSSSTTYTTVPVSEGVSFEDVQFEASSNALAAYVLDSGKFCRIQFLNCRFSYIKCLLTPTDTYTQSIYFTKCMMREWAGTFYKTPTAYDLSFEGNFIEWGVDFCTTTTSTVGFRFINNLLEGCTGKPLSLAYCAGTVVGNYFEHNDISGTTSGAGPYIDFVNAAGVEFSGNLFVLDTAAVPTPQKDNSAYFAVHWGPITCAHSGGNYCNGRLHNLSDITSGSFVSIGDMPLVAGGPNIILGNIVVGKTTATASAALDLDSTVGSLLIPRMSTTQRDALTPLNGMQIYNSTLNKFQGYENGAWTSLI